MQQSRRNRLRTVVAVVILVPLLLIGGFAFYVASEAGELPWQEDPTAIPVVPFGGLDSSGQPLPTETPTP
jgi:hypothetical protein